MKAFDYIIVGAGAAGCVLAHRLSENPKVSVALLEAGTSTNHPFVHMPKGLGKIMFDANKTWNYPAEPEMGNRYSTSESWARGRLMGGSSAINGMMYVRGQPDDYQALAKQTSDDWSWKHIAQAYRQLENHELGGNSSRGDKGPLKLSLPDRHNPLLNAMLEAGHSLGWEIRDDFNQPDNQECIAYAPRTIWKGVRQSAYTAFIKPILSRNNLTIIKQATVDTVLFDGLNANGVAVQHNNHQEIVNANKEVILCGGAMATPGILQRSGIGSAEHLKKLGIAIKVDNPEVGKNLQEHRIIMLQWKLQSPFSENNEYSGVRLLKNVFHYYLTRKGPMSSAAYEIAARMKSNPELTRPDMQFIIAPYSFDFETGREKLEQHPGMNIACHPLRPTSRGEIMIKSNNPDEMPRLKPNYRSTQHDCELMVKTVQAARQYIQQSPLASMIESETYPGPSVTSSDKILDAYDQYASCGFHAVGSCRMGADEQSVVDPACQVRGVNRLRIMDTSVMPQIPSGNTNGPTMAMAWRAADIIQRDQNL
ncbi:MAG: GMC family oxidoreductase N-terminal domain-containing protein [Spongiibacteraceae bacterium]|nr:GMC family oxidoreductase N-terminal domain-containing protein [Spongiibacteraceae bacterium]